MPVDGSPAAFIAFGENFFPSFFLLRKNFDNDRHRFFRSEKLLILDIVRKKR